METKIKPTVRKAAILHNWGFYPYSPYFTSLEIKLSSSACHDVSFNVTFLIKLAMKQ